MKAFIWIKVIFLLSIFSFHKTQAQQSDNVKYYLNLANEKILNKDYTGAIEDCEVAELLCPNCTAPLYQKMLIYATTKKFKEAEKALKKAYSLNKSSNEYARYSIILKYEKGLMNEVYSDIQKEIDKDSINIKATIWYHLRASYYTKERKYKLAYQDNQKILFLNPSSSSVLNSIILHEIVTEQTEKYTEHLKEYVFNEQKKDSVSVYGNMGMFCYYLKQYTNAVKYCDSCLKLNKSSLKASVYKALSLAQLGEYDSALAYINKDIKKRPNDASLINNRGFIFLLGNKIDSAVADFEKTIEMDNNDPHPYTNLAYIYHNSDKEKAKEYYKKGLQIGGVEYIPYWKLSFD